jgi:hypothetical protein
MDQKAGLSMNQAMMGLSAIIAQVTFPTPVAWSSERRIFRE